MRAWYCRGEPNVVIPLGPIVELWFGAKSIVGWDSIAKLWMWFRISA